MYRGPGALTGVGLAEPEPLLLLLPPREDMGLDRADTDEEEAIEAGAVAAAAVVGVVEEEEEEV